MKAGTNKISKHHFEKRNSIAETDIKQMLDKSYKSDFMGSKIRKEVIVRCRANIFEDKKFLEIMDKETKLVDGNYQVPLAIQEGECNISK